MASKDIARYNTGNSEYGEAKDFTRSPLTLSDLGNTLALSGGGSAAATIAIVAGDIASGGMVAGVTLAISAVLSALGKRGRLKIKLGELTQNEIELPQGAMKSMLPLAGRFFPLEFQVDTLEPLRKESINRRLTQTDPRNMTKRSYLVRTVKGKPKYYELPSSNPIESWDVLFSQETGRFIDTYRPESKGMYSQLDSRKTLDIATAKVRVTIDKSQGKETPIWIQELAAQKLY